MHTHMRTCRYAGGEAEGSIAAAVSQILTLVATHAPLEARHDSNAFRLKYCYTELTDTELKRHKPSLLALFDVTCIHMHAHACTCMHMHAHTYTYIRIHARSCTSPHTRSLSGHAANG